MDRIELSNMQFYGYHGVFEEENKLGQRFIIDLSLLTSLQEAGRTDDLRLSIDYSEIYEVTKGIVTGPPYKLLEAVGEKIAITLLQKYPQVKQVNVTVKKPEVPIAGILDYAAIAIERNRSALKI